MAKDFLRNISVALIYITLALPAIFLGKEEGIPAPFWPASGFALFALLHYGYKIIPGIFFGVVAANYGMELTAATPPNIATSIFALVSGIGNVLEVVIIGVILGHKTPTTIISNAKTAFQLIGAAILGTFVSALLGNINHLFYPTLPQHSYST